MNPGRNAQLKEIVLTAAAMAGEERSAYLAGACTGDTSLRAEAEALLAGHERTTAATRPGALDDVLARAVEAARPAPLPDRIGPYRILALLGEGGMGSVFRARQEEPVRRDVALKVIRGGDSGAILVRFASERQTLAQMDHANIATLLDAGSTPDGRLWFAMELVEGAPITTFARDAKLDVTARLRLFLDVCRAVRHAHQKGIIHRDLKPSNVLVTMAGDQPVPKVIDFGIARGLGDSLVGTEYRTRTGQIVGTVEYMSPEQARGESHRVDTRSDVYALGVLLYELLADRFPYDVTGRPLHEAVRVIADEPPRPLRRTMAGAGRTSGAPGRRIDPDVETIVRMCLEKDPERRYGSAAQLAEDLERLLASRPILARPPSTIYQLRKMVARHRAAFAATAAVIVALTAGVIGTSVGMVRARREREQARQESATAEQALRFLTDLFKVSDPSTARGKTVTARELLDKGTERIEKELADEPRIQGRLMLTMAEVYMNLGLFEKAEPLFKQSLEISRRALGEDDPATLSSLHGLAWVYERQGRYPEAEAIDTTVVAKRRRILGPEHADTLRSMYLLAVIIEREKRYEEALKMQIELLEIRRRTLPEDDPRTITSVQSVAADYEWLGRYKEAEALYRQAAESQKRVLGADHPDTLWIMANLGRIEGRVGNYDEAEKIVRETIENRRRVLGPDHPDTLYTMPLLARAYARHGRFAEAERIHREAYEGLRRALGEEHPYTLGTKSGLAYTIARQHRLDEAEKMCLEVLEARRRLSGSENPQTMDAMSDLAYVLVEQKRYEEAEKLYRQALDVNRRVLGPEAVATIGSLQSLGEVCARQGRLEEAETLYRQALDIVNRLMGPQSPDAFYTQLGLAGVAALRGQSARALELIRQVTAAGYQDHAGNLANDPDLASLHGNPEFERLVAVASGNTDPRGARAD